MKAITRSKRAQLHQPMGYQATVATGNSGCDGGTQGGRAAAEEHCVPCLSVLSVCLRDTSSAGGTRSGEGGSRIPQLGQRPPGPQAPGWAPVAGMDGPGWGNWGQRLLTSFTDRTGRYWSVLGSNSQEGGSWLGLLEVAAPDIP